MREEAEQGIILREALDKAIEAAQPSHCLRGHLPPSPTKKMIVLAAGKAAAAMMQIVEQHYKDLWEEDRFVGLAVTRHGFGLELEKAELVEAGHPVPDEFSQQGAEKALKLARSAQAGDLVLVLLSGGGSALWSAPVEGVSLFDKQELTRQLLRSGADIVEINCVRKHLSSIKGGGLARAVAPALLVSLIISDVVGDDLSSIASGPVSGDPSSLADARAILAKYNLTPSEQIIKALAAPNNETLFPDDPLFVGTSSQIVASGALSLSACELYLRRLGYRVVNLGDRVEGEARDVAYQHAQRALEIQKQIREEGGQPVALLSGGELTVTIKGHGVGGPNQEYALALAMALEGAPGLFALAADTDGCDGGRGEATDPAGALVFPSTLSRARGQKLNPATFLADNASGTFFYHLGDHVDTGPTHTNVNDFRLILIHEN